MTDDKHTPTPLFNYSLVCWKELTPLDLPRNEIYDRILNKQDTSSLADIPMDEIAQEFIQVFSKGKRNPQRISKFVEWKTPGAIHRAEINRNYFCYGYTASPDNEVETTPDSWEICDIPEIAGKFGCVVYFPNFDTILLRPIGFTVRTPTILNPKEHRSKHHDKSDLCQVTQLPLSSLDARHMPPPSEDYVTLRISHEELERRT